MPTADEAKATREFAIFDVLVGQFGTRLPPRLIDEINRVMEDGPTAWAFKGPVAAHPTKPV